MNKKNPRPSSFIVRHSLHTLGVVAVPAAAACVALVVPALLAGISPLELLSAIWTGAWGNGEAAAASIAKVTPLLLTGLSVGIAWHGGLLNIGCEGQLTLGALGAASIAIFASSLPGPVLVVIVPLAGALIGALWALPAVLIKQKRDVHEVVTTLFMNYVAVYLAEYLVLGPLGDGSAMGRTPSIPGPARWTVFQGPDGFGITAAPVFALVLCFGVQFWLRRTVWGYETRACGTNPLAAGCAGIRVKSRQRWVFAASGALAGLAGAMEVIAVHHRFYNAFSPGYGFDGITASFLVNGEPAWMALSALLLASLRAADKWLQIALGVSPNIIVVLQAILLLAVACRPRVLSRLFGRGVRPGGPQDACHGGQPEHSGKESPVQADTAAEVAP